MLLNQMRSEDSNPEELLRQSFHQYQCDRALPKLQVIFFPFFPVLFVLSEQLYGHGCTTHCRRSKRRSELKLNEVVKIM